jgi:hypothetical protein
MRLIFDMATGVNGRPVGVKAIASYLNERGFFRRGRRFTTAASMTFLTSTTYYGRHYSTAGTAAMERPGCRRSGSRSRFPRSSTRETFNAAQGLLQSRAPKRMPPRVANGLTFLAALPAAATAARP